MHCAVRVLLALHIPLGVAAQQVTGNVQGRVLGPAGQPVADVQVTAAGLGLQGDRVVSTDARGGFVFTGLPVGSYSVAIRGIGYRPMRVQDVAVRLGTTTTLGDVRLEAQVVELPEVIVSGARPVIDPVSPASSATLDSSQFRSLPAGRDYRDLIPFVPQANASPYASTFESVNDPVNIGGSTGLENAFYVDGMNVTVLTGTSIALPSNFVREIQVNTAGYEAEYGRALSGVINVVTPSGGNEFHGQALGYFTADELRTEPRVGVGEANPVNFNQYDVGLSLSGPVLRDRLWYSVAYNPASANSDVLLAAIPKQRDTQLRHQLAGKLTWRPGGNTDVALTFLGDPYVHDWLLGYVRPLTTDPNTVLVHETGGGTTLAVEGRQRLGPRTQLTVGVSHLGRHLDLLPQSGDTGLAAWTRLDDLITDVSSGGALGFDTSRESRTAVRLALTLLAGRHSWRFGAEFEDNRFAEGGIYTEISRSLDTLSDTVYVWTENYGHEQVRNRVPTVYVQDAWEVSPRLRVSAGLRWESQHMTGDVGPARTIASELAPRLGLVYELGAPGSQRLFASAGRFYEQIPLWAVIFWNSTGKQLYRQYPQNPLVDSSNGVYLSPPFIYGKIPATPDLLGQSYDQLTAGYDRALSGSIKVSAHVTYRVLHWAIEDGVPPGDSVLRMGNPGRGPLATMPRAQQHYAALELAVERATPGPLYLMASYVLSRNIGNYTGLYATDYGLAHPNSGPQYDFPDLMTNAYGLLPNDRPHVAKAAASYRFGFGATLGAFFTAASGTPLNEYGSSAYSTGFSTYYTFLRPRGSVGRTPAIWSLDLHGSYDLPVARGARVRPKFLLDVFNVGSPREALLYDQVHYFDHAQTQPNSTYGAVTRYQPPMSARVGVIVDF